MEVHLPNLDFSQTTQAARSALLATKVVKVLRARQTGGPLRAEDAATLRRGAELLAQILQGSLLVEQRAAASGVSPSQQGLFAFGHALTALQKLDAGLNDNLSDLFLRLREQLSSIAQGGPVAGAEASAPPLVPFFRTLASLFEADVVIASQRSHAGRSSFPV